MQTKDDFIATLRPIAGDFAAAYDWKSIADEAGEFDPEEGWRLRESIAEDMEANGYSDELNAILAAHERETAKVYCWYDYDLSRWRYDFAEVENVERIDTIALPPHFTTYETVYGEIFATVDEGDGTHYGAWKIQCRHHDDTYIICDATGERDSTYACPIVGGE